jgi:putative Mg2+ transporter-C (MgtC) family protein
MSWQTILHEIRPEILLRLAISMIVGLVLGIEREIHGRAAGLRTTLLVCLASAVAMIISEAFYTESFAQNPDPGWRPDPARLAAGVLAGMGFLGAGVIIHQRSHVIRGVTTAATLWLASILGLAVGAGAIGVGLVATVIAAIILNLIPRLEDHIPNDWYSDLTVEADSEISSVEEINALIRSFGVKIKGINWQEDIVNRRRTLTLHLKYKKGDHFELPAKMITSLSLLPGIKKAHWHV